MPTDTLPSLAISFSKKWENASNEKRESQNFLRDFLNIFGIILIPSEHFEYEVCKNAGERGYIDCLIKEKIAIEMKSRGENLDKAFMQLKEYVQWLPENFIPEILMVCDFETIILDIDKKKIEFKTKDLRKHLDLFGCLLEKNKDLHLQEQIEVNVKAAEKMAKLHDALKDCGYAGNHLEVYLVRLLFCLFAEDTGIFPKYSFLEYIERTKKDGSDLSEKIARLFQILNISDKDRSKKTNLSSELLDFQYINGGLFSDNLDIADFTEKMRNTLIECAKFDWSHISPAIFGAMFQGVVDKEHRRELGVHYTSEENILKLINPLFMDNLREEFESVKNSPKKLDEFHNKIASLKFLDPACGCGNFLIISYRELRRLELEILKKKIGKNRQLTLDIMWNLLRVNVEQFCGIEHEEFPCEIAKVGMWLIDHQMNLEASDLFGCYYARLPLTQSAKIVCGNALRVDWESVVPKSELSYILGNPPFVGARLMSPEQKEDMLNIFGANFNGVGNLDYVTAWYKRAADYALGTDIKCAFVSTNSISQGEQVALLWKPLFEKCNVRINFAYKSFIWNNEAKGKAAVHCVIVGFNVGAHPVSYADTPLEAGNRTALLFKNFKDIRSLPYNKKLDKLANEKRKEGWLHEVVIWNKLKHKQFLGMDFYRQQIIGNFIVDFYSPNGGVVIEADGKSHETKIEYDAKRDEYLKSLGLIVIHIQVKDILENMDKVLEHLKEELEKFSKEKFPASSGVPAARQVGCAPPKAGKVYIRENATRSTEHEAFIYEPDGSKIRTKNINPYLIDAPSIFIESRSKPLCDVPEIGIGNKPIDDGNYLFTESEKDEFLKKEPQAAKWFKKWIGSDEFINRYFRYCLWLGDCSPDELRKMPECIKRVEAVRQFRLDSKSDGTRKIAETPRRFHVENMPQGTYIIIPRVSSEKRKYIPIGFITPDILASDSAHIIPNATLYHFGILTSSVHNAWTRAICGRLKSDYRYSKDIVYNNFVWPNATDEQKATIEKLAQGVLDARAKFPESSLADLYDPLAMPPELLKAHRELDKAVMKLYGFGKDVSEAEIVAELMGRYQILLKKDDLI